MASSSSAAPEEEEDMFIQEERYFEFANEQVKKAIMAQHDRLIDDAIFHLHIAQIILREAIANITSRVVDFFSREEEMKLEFFRQRLIVFENQISQRIVILQLQSGSTSSFLETTARKPIGTQMVSNYVEMINSVFVDTSPSVKWDDIVGLEKAKQSLARRIILPIRCKHLYEGRTPPPPIGVILCGTHGTDKVVLARAAASEFQATFFCISASSFDWVGDGEKFVQTLFEVAVSRQPSVIFIDQIDSIISARTSNEDDASKRLKSELLVQFDAVSSHSNDVFVIGSTNNPRELEDVLPWGMVNVEPETLVRDTDGYSGWYLQSLCKEVAMMLIIKPAQYILGLIRKLFKMKNSGDKVLKDD